MFDEKISTLSFCQWNFGGNIVLIVLKISQQEDNATYQAEDPRKEIKTKMIH